MGRSGGISAEEEPPDVLGPLGLFIGTFGATGWKSKEAGLSAGLLCSYQEPLEPWKFLKLGQGTSRAAGWAL